MAPTDLGRDLQSLVRPRWRHADIHDGHIRRVPPDTTEERVPIRGLARDLDPRGLQDPPQPGPEKSGIVRDGDAHRYPAPSSSGRSATIDVPASAGLSMRSRPPRAATLSPRPSSPEPLAVSAPPTPSSETSTRSQLSEVVTETVACDARACLPTLVSDSETTK